MSDYVKAITVTLDSVTVYPGNESSTLGNVDVSSYIPNGYKMIAVIQRTTGNVSFFFRFAYMLDSTHISAVVKNTGNGEETGAPTVVLLCVKS